MSSSKYLQEFDKIDKETDGIITTEINNLQDSYMILVAEFGGIVKKQAHLEIQQSGIEALQSILQEEEAELKNTKNVKKAQEYRRKLNLCEAERVQNEKELKTQRVALEKLRDSFAKDSLTSLHALWSKRPSDSEQLQVCRKKLDEANAKLQENKATEAALSAELSAEKNKVKKLSAKLAVLEDSIDEKEKILKDKHRELEKGYYDNVQKLVEGRVNDEKAKLADQLSQAEEKIIRFDKLCAVNKELDAKVINLTHELAVLQQAKLELEQRYKKREEEGKVFKQGYDQLSNDIRAVCTEKIELQTECDDLKKQYKELLEQKSQSNSGANITLHSSVARSQVPSTAAVYERHEAELEHLNGLVTVWQNTLNTAKANLHESEEKKKVLQDKIKDVEALLKELKPKPKPKPKKSSKQRRATKSNATTEYGQEQTATQENATQEPPNFLLPTFTPRNPKPRAGTSSDAFPPLALPFAPISVPSNRYKSLRVVIVPKKETPSDGDESSDVQE